MLKITNPQDVLDQLFAARDGETFFRVAKAVAYQFEWPALSATLWTLRASRVVPASGGVTTEVEEIYSSESDTDATSVNTASCWDNTDDSELGSVVTSLPRVDGELLLPVVRQYRADIHAVGELLRKDESRAQFFPPQKSIADTIAGVVSYKSADLLAKENEATLDSEAVKAALSSPAVVAMEAARKARKIARAEAWNAKVGTSESAVALAKAAQTDAEHEEQELAKVQTEVDYVLAAFAGTKPAALDYDTWFAMPLWFQHRVATAVYDVIAAKLAGINTQRMMQRANESDKAFAAREAARDALVELCSDLAEELSLEASNWEVVADQARRA